MTRLRIDHIAMQKAEKAIFEKTLQKTLKFSAVAKVFENKFGQVVEKASNLILRLRWPNTVLARAFADAN